MPHERSATVFQWMGNVNDLTVARTPHAILPAIVSWEYRLEEAVLFLAKSLTKAPKKGKKPVIMHSLRVGSALISRGCSEDVVIAGMLHDIMEKSSVTPREISRRFGVAVALMVGATTNKMTLTKPLERYEDSLKRCAAVGEGALMVRAADLMDNCDRLTALGQLNRLGRLGAKVKILLQYCKAYEMDARVVSDLNLRLKRIAKITGTLALLAPAPRKKAQPASRSSVQPQKTRKNT